MRLRVLTGGFWQGKIFVDVDGKEEKTLIGDNHTNHDANFSVKNEEAFHIRAEGIKSESFFIQVLLTKDERY